MTTTAKFTAAELNARLLEIDPKIGTDESISDRYPIDFGLLPTRRWAQMDTEEDGAWFGMWTEPTTRRILTYAEGDLTLVAATTDHEYVDALRDAVRDHQASGTWKGIDAYYDEPRRRLLETGAGDLLYACWRDAGENGGNHQRRTNA